MEAVIFIVLHERNDYSNRSGLMYFYSSFFLNSKNPFLLLNCGTRFTSLFDAMLSG